MKLRTSLLTAVALAALALPDGHASAQTVAATTYDVVTSYEFASTTSVSVTGVPHGQTKATTTLYYAQTADMFAAYQRMLLVMLNRPGRFQLTIDSNSSPARWTLAALP